MPFCLRAISLGRHNRHKLMVPRMIHWYMAIRSCCDAVPRAYPRQRLSPSQGPGKPNSRVEASSSQFPHSAWNIGHSASVTLRTAVPIRRPWDVVYWAGLRSRILRKGSCDGREGSGLETPPRIKLRPSLRLAAQSAQIWFPGICYDLGRQTNARRTCRTRRPCGTRGARGTCGTCGACGL